MSKKYTKAWFLETAKFKVNKISILTILFAIVVDVVGCVFASSVSIPFWLDSIGTMTTAIQFGPIAGCIVSLFSAGILVLIGAASPIWLCVNLMVALVVGFMFPGNREEDALGVVSLAIFAGLISAATYLPVNLYYFKGLPQNTWGDSLYYMLSNRVNNPVVNAFLAEAFITVPDRVLSIFIAIFLVNVEKVRILKQKRKKWAKLGSSMTLVVAIVLSLFFRVGSVYAGNNIDMNARNNVDMSCDSSVDIYNGNNVDMKTGSSVDMNIGGDANMYAGSSDVSYASDDIFDEEDKEAAKEDAIEDTTVYETVFFGSEDGILASEVNAVVQTKDGYIWVGTYSGLYRYDGIHFEECDFDDRIRTVMTLIVDSKDRLWIGTNESGACCYDMENGEIRFYSTENGLAADSIREIGEDSLGNIYIGTVLAVSRISPKGEVVTYNDWEDIYYAQSFENAGNGRVIGVTSGGRLFVIENDNLILVKQYDKAGDIYYRCVSCADGEILVGTNTNIFERYTLEGNEMILKDTIDTGNLNFCNMINYYPEKDCFFFCAENGMGVIDRKTGRVIDMTQRGFEGAVSDTCVDYQGNIWYASSKYGLIKFSETPFKDVNNKSGIEKTVVNAVMKDGDYLYIGTDKGLQIVDVKTGEEIEKEYQKEIGTTRIRHIYMDGDGCIYLSVYGEAGVYIIDKNDKITKCSREISNWFSIRCRYATKLSDGRLAVSSNDGVAFIKDGKLESVVGENEGLSNQYILSMMEREDGSLLAASDGDGIYVIKDGEVVGHIGKQEGLETAVVLRIVKCTGGYLYVTSNALYYDNGEIIKKLDKFPYSNNYDILITEDRTCWITSSAGLYVVGEDALLSNRAYSCTLLNENWGLNTSFTANSWNVLDDNMLYLCCINGVKAISINDYNRSDTDYMLQLESIRCGDGDLVYEDSEGWHIKPTSGRIEFNIAVNNYSLSNPMVHYYLDASGFNDDGITCRQNEVVPLSFTNLPYGEYKLVIEILDERTGVATKSSEVRVIKHAMMYEKLYFKAYLFAVLVLLGSYIIWLFVSINRRTSSIIGLQKEMQTDPMTGIYNKAGSTRMLKAACSEDNGVLLMIDLDSFKLVNDLYGHDMGDRILIRFAELLREASKEGDIVGRMGGDEFVGFLRNVTSEEEVEKFTVFMNKEIVKSAKEYMGEDMNIPLGTSIGAVRVPEEGRDYDDLFRFADKALYVVKQNGKHGYAFYQSGSEKNSSEEEGSKNKLEQIKKIIGERNEGKGAFNVNFDKLQVIYKYINRNNKMKGIQTGFIKLSISENEGSKVTDEIKERFEDYLIKRLNKNDVISVYAGGYFILCEGREDYNSLADELVKGWYETEGNENHPVVSEVETVG